MARHNALNDVLWRALQRANIPSVKEPPGLIHTDMKRPDGITQIPWSEGKCITWDVTVTDTLAAFNLLPSSTVGGGAAEAAARRKEDKYLQLRQHYHFVPVAFETLGPVNASGAQFIDDIGKRLRAVTDDSRESSFLWQRLSVTLQRYNAICFRDTFTCESLLDTDTL